MIGKQSVEYSPPWGGASAIWKIYLKLGIIVLSLQLMSLADT